MAKKEHLRTAKAALMRALEITEKLLDGFPIPGAKGTIGAILQIINDAEVRTKIQLPFIILITTIENGNQRRALQRIEGTHPEAARPTTSAPIWKNGRRYS